MKYLFLISALLFTLFIWSNSFEVGNVSKQQSGAVAEVVIDVTESITNKKPDRVKIEFSLRKCAHFVEFFMCGSLFMIALYLFDLKKAQIFSLIILLSIAIIDESIQLFRNGRNASINDVLLDFVAAMLAISIIHTFIRYRRLIS